MPLRGTVNENNLFRIQQEVSFPRASGKKDRPDNDAFVLVKKLGPKLGPKAIESGSLVTYDPV